MALSPCRLADFENIYNATSHRNARARRGRHFGDERSVILIAKIMKRHLLYVTIAAVSLPLPAFANLVYTCDATVDATHAGTCAALQGSTVAGVYNGIFGSSITSNVY